MNIDIGKIIILGQILNLGQFTVSVQGHFRVNLCQDKLYHKVQTLLENGGGAYSVPVRVDATRKLVVE